MDFESLKEQFIERFETYRNQVQDSEIYIRLKERYDTLPHNAQTGIKVGSILFGIYIVMGIPFGFTSSAGESLERFEENRQLTRDLIRAGRIKRSLVLPPPAPTESALSSDIESRIEKKNVMPEQKIGVTPLKEVASKKLVPKGITQYGAKARIKKLNLTQTLKLGESLNEIPSSKLINIAIQADKEDPHFFNVDYEVAAFSVPIKKTTVIEDKSKNKGKKKKSRFKSKRKKK